MAKDPNEQVWTAPDLDMADTPEVEQPRTGTTPTLAPEKEDFQKLKSNINIEEFRKKSISEIINYLKSLWEKYTDNGDLEQVRKLLWEKLLKEPSYIAEAIQQFGKENVRDYIIWPFIYTSEFLQTFKNKYWAAKIEENASNIKPVLLKKAWVFKDMLLHDYKLSQEWYDTFIKELFGDEMRMAENIDAKIKFEQKFEEAESLYQDMLKWLGNPKEMPQAFKELVKKQWLYGAVRDVAYKHSKMWYGNAKMLATLTTLWILIWLVWKAYKKKQLGKLLFWWLIWHFALAGATGYGLTEHIKRWLFGWYDEIIDQNKALYDKMKRKEKWGKEDEWVKIVKRETKKTQELVEQAERDGLSGWLEIARWAAIITALFDEEAKYGDIKWKYLTSNGKHLDFDVDKYIADLRKQWQNDKADQIEEDVKKSWKENFKKHILEVFENMGITAETYDEIPSSKKLIDLSVEAYKKKKDESWSPWSGGNPDGSWRRSGWPLRQWAGLEWMSESNAQYHVKDGKAFLVWPDGQKHIVDVDISTPKDKLERLKQNYPKLYLAVVSWQIMASYYQAEADGMFFKWTGWRWDKQYKGLSGSIMDTVNNILNNPEDYNAKWDNGIRTFANMLFEWNEQKSKDFRAAIFDNPNESIQDKKFKMINFFRNNYNVPFIIWWLLEEEILNNDKFREAKTIINDEALIGQLVEEESHVYDDAKKQSIYSKFKNVGLTNKQIDELLERISQLKKTFGNMPPKDKNKIVDQMIAKGFQWDRTKIFEAYVACQKHMWIKMLLKSTVIEWMIKNNESLRSDKFINLYDDVKWVIWFWNLSDESKKELINSLTRDALLMFVGVLSGYGVIAVWGKILDAIWVARYLKWLKRVWEWISFYEWNQFMTNVFLGETYWDLLYGMNPIDRNNAIEMWKSTLFFATMSVFNKVFGKIWMSALIEKWWLAKASWILTEILLQSWAMVWAWAGIDIIFSEEHEHHWSYQEVIQAVMLTAMMYKAGRIWNKARVEISRGERGSWEWGITVKIFEGIKGKATDIKNSTQRYFEWRKINKEFTSMIKTTEKDFNTGRDTATPESLDAKKTDAKNKFEEYIWRFPETDTFWTTFDFRIKYDAYLEALKNWDQAKINETKKELELAQKRRKNMLKNSWLVAETDAVAVSEKTLNKHFNSLMEDIKYWGKEYVELNYDFLKTKFENYLAKGWEIDWLGSTFNMRNKFNEFLEAVKSKDETKIKNTAQELEQLQKKWIEELNKNKYLTEDEDLSANTEKNIEIDFENQIRSIENWGKEFTTLSEEKILLRFEEHIYRFPEAENFPSTKNLMEKYYNFIEKSQWDNLAQIEAAKKELKRAHKDRIQSLKDNNLLEKEKKSDSDRRILDRTTSWFDGERKAMKKNFDILVNDMYVGKKGYIERNIDNLKWRFEEYMGTDTALTSKPSADNLKIKFGEYIKALTADNAGTKEWTKKIEKIKKELRQINEKRLDDVMNSKSKEKKKEKKEDISKNLKTDFKNFIDPISSATPESVKTNKADIKAIFEEKLNKYNWTIPSADALKVKFEEFLNKKEAGEDVGTLKDEVINAHNKRIEDLINRNLIKLEEKSEWSEEDAESGEWLISDKEKSFAKKWWKLVQSVWDKVFSWKEFKELYNQISPFKAGKNWKNLIEFVLFGDPKYKLKFREDGATLKKIMWALYKAWFFWGITGQNLWDWLVNDDWHIGKWGLDLVGYWVLNRLLFYVYMYRDLSIWDKDPSPLVSNGLLGITKGIVDQFWPNAGKNVVNFLSHMLPAQDIERLKQWLWVYYWDGKISYSGKGDRA